jgi:hypothetical protein
MFEKNFPCAAGPGPGKLDLGFAALGISALLAIPQISGISANQW